MSFWVRRRPGQDLLVGALAGWGATWLMGKVSGWVSPYIRPEQRQKEKRASEGSAPVKAATRTLGAVGFRIPEEKRGKVGNLVHYGVGITSGAVYGLLSRRSRAVRAGAGLLYGAGMWLLGDELLVPLLGLGAPPQRYPVSTHARALAAHLAYGAGVDRGLRVLRQALL